MFTLSNNRSQEARIYERLDRAYVKGNWLQKYSKATILNLPILRLTSPTIRKTKSLIKMEAWCLEFQETTSIISTHWNLPVTRSPKVGQKCRCVRYNLFKWSKNYKERHNIRWEEQLNQCGDIQANLP